MVKAEVEAEKDITAVCVENKKHPVDYLNALEKTDNPWPHDEAYCFLPHIGIYVRYHRLRGRKDFTPAEDRDRQFREQTEELKALKATSALQNEALKALKATSASQNEELKALKATSASQKETIARQGSELQACKVALAEQGAALSAILDRLNLGDSSRKKGKES